MNLYDILDKVFSNAKYISYMNKQNFFMNLPEPYKNSYHILLLDIIFQNSNF